MSTETAQKRFHLEKIIQNISHDSLLESTVPFNANSVFAKKQRKGISQDTDNCIVDEAMSVESDDEDRSEKEDIADAEEEFNPMSTRVSPRCDVCCLLHFKSYRCVTRLSAPYYLRKLFDHDSNEKLRVCRKCLASKENCIENVAVSSLTTYSSQIQQMKIPLGMTCERRTKAFEFVVRDLKHLKSDEYSKTALYPLENETGYTSPPNRRTILEKFNVDDPVQKNCFLKELNLQSSDAFRNMSDNSDSDEKAYSSSENGSVDISDQARGITMSDNDSLYHVAAKDVPTTLRNITEKKIGEMFDARKGAAHDLVVHTKRAWKPNKKYDDMRKIEHGKKQGKRGNKGKSTPVKNKEEMSDSDLAEKIRTCGINCAVCTKHVQKSYSCCTLQTAPEKYKHLFIPGVTRLKICRKCIPYKKPIVKDENQLVVKKKMKVKQKRGRKPKSEKPGAIVTSIPLDGDLQTKQGATTSTAITVSNHAKYTNSQ